MPQATKPKEKEKSASPDRDLASLPGALAYEHEIAVEAYGLREKDGVTRANLDRLYELLQRPIPPAFIQTIGRVKGKPYESTGIKSVQVQIDRLNNVLGPAHWGYIDDYALDGKLCKVTAQIVDSEGNPLIARSSWGGVDHASTNGNLYKGSFTNAAKVAFARLGPGHEVYVGVEDFDPDVSQAIADDAAQRAEAPASPKATAVLPDEDYENLRKLYLAKQVSEENYKMLLLSLGVEHTAALDREGYEKVVEYLHGLPDKTEASDG